MRFRTPNPSRRVAISASARDAKKVGTMRNQNMSRPETMDELFSHPEEHHSLAKSGSPDEQLSCANLFLEPVQAPRSTA
jgi:hypothetical protein